MSARDALNGDAARAMASNGVLAMTCAIVVGVSTRDALNGNAARAMASNGVLAMTCANVGAGRALLVLRH
jgi:hypothetical protein